MSASRVDNRDPSTRMVTMNTLFSQNSDYNKENMSSRRLNEIAEDETADHLMTPSKSADNYEQISNQSAKLKLIQDEEIQRALECA